MMRLTIGRTLLFAFTLLACDAVTGPICACSPLATPRFKFLGYLSTAAGAPAPGHRIWTQVAMLPCAVWKPPQLGYVTDVNGRYSLYVSSNLEDSVCVRFSAQDTTAGAVEVALAQTARVLLKRQYPSDSAQLDLRLP